jgi:predicted alpha-1,6-mannanase (GH76 family)
MSLLLLASAWQCFATTTTGDDFNANTATATTTLQQWYNSSGLWNTTGWWNGANCIEAIENDILANNDTNYLTTLQNTFTLNKGGNFLDSYYDDDGWWANAWIRAYDLTGNTSYLNMAKTIFNAMTNAWSSHCNGGIWWSTGQTYKNAVANNLFMLTAIRLHQRTPTDGMGYPGYFYWATNTWAWYQSVGMINVQNLVNDGLDNTNCLNNGQSTWTYNQGVLIGALTDFYKSTGSNAYLNEARAVANATITNLVDANGVLEEPPPCHPTCGGGDVPEFKGIGDRYIAYLYDETHDPAYYSFLYKSAHAIWFNDRNNSTSNQFGMSWDGPFDSADGARQSSAIMGISALAQPVTSLLPFARGSGDPSFNHSEGMATGAVAWACSPTIAGGAGLMQYGPYLTSLPTGQHVIHYRMAVDSLSSASSNLVLLLVLQNGTTIASENVPWNVFTSTNQAQDFPLPFTNTIAGAWVDFRVFWNAVPGAPTLTLSDVTVDGARNWTGANLAHDIGRLDGNNNWEADPVRDTSSGYLAKGPGTAELGSGNYAAQFELKVDNFNWDKSTVATLSVVNTDSSTIVASRDVARSEFANVRYCSFPVYFQAVAGAHYDFRTYWYYATNAPRLTERSVVVAPATALGFSPVALTAGSYNEDMVIERTAPAMPGGAYTSASMDAGTGNTGTSWYEQGYDTAAPSTGLPTAGSTLTNPVSPDHIYTLAPSWTGNNVAMVNSNHSANLVPGASSPFSALSFLASAGHGPAAVDYRVMHADGTQEAGTFTAPDWFNNAPVVFYAQGRVDVVAGTFNSVNNNEERLYAEDITLTNIGSQVTNISLSWDTNNGSGSLAAIFALSGVAVPPVTLGIASSNGQVILTWPFGQLLQATNINGPWASDYWVSSPYQVPAVNSSLFYRVQVQ